MTPPGVAPSFATVIAGLPVALAVALAILAVFAILAIGMKIGMLVGRLHAERGMRELVESGRQDAVKRSRAVIGGQAAEQFAPFLPGFPADATEVRFVGKPVDYVSFSGSSRGAIEEILFIEVKTGSSRLSPVEKSLRDAIAAGKVRYVEYRPSGD
jgi:predicted Holliday junction resolvase-like endonuclease